MTQTSDVSRTLQGLPGAVRLISSTQVFSVYQSCGDLSSFKLSCLSPLDIIGCRHIMGRVDNVITMCRFYSGLSSVLRRSLVSGEGVFTSLRLRFSSFDTSRGGFVPPCLCHQFRLLECRDDKLRGFSETIRVVPGGIALSYTKGVRGTERVCSRVKIDLHGGMGGPLLRGLRRTRDTLTALECGRQVSSMRVRVSPTRRRVLSVLGRCSFIVCFNCDGIICNPADHRLITVHGVVRILHAGPSIGLLVRNCTSTSNNNMICGRSITCRHTVSIGTRFRLCNTTRDRLRIVYRISGLSTSISVSRSRRRGGEGMTFSAQLGGWG